jgi:hypothetical protein
MRREKRKIVMKEGDADQFYVEKYIGYVLTHPNYHILPRSRRIRVNFGIMLISRRRAVGRRPDGTSRIFEYLVKWLQWPTDTSTWYVPFPPLQPASPSYTKHLSILS